MAITKSVKTDEKTPAKTAPAPSTTVKKTVTPPAKKPEAKKGEEAKGQATEKAVKASRKDVAAAIREKVMAANAAISPKIAEMCVIAFEDVVTEMLIAGRQVALLGFGTFTAVPKAEQTRPNPQKSDEMITIPAHIAPRFKAGKQFKMALNPKLDVDEDESGE